MILPVFIEGVKKEWLADSGTDMDSFGRERHRLHDENVPASQQNERLSHSRSTWLGMISLVTYRPRSNSPSATGTEKNKETSQLTSAIVKSAQIRANGCRALLFLAEFTGGRVIEFELFK